SACWLRPSGTGVQVHSERAHLHKRPIASEDVSSQMGSRVPVSSLCDDGRLPSGFIARQRPALASGCLQLNEANVCATRRGASRLSYTHCRTVPIETRRAGDFCTVEPLALLSASTERPASTCP